jgi:uncharacterized membrane protein YbaN (DUF454 family)
VNNSENITCTHIGGQAVIEGVMMRGRSSVAVAVREPSGNVATECKRAPDVKKSIWYRIPVVRGVFNLFSSLGLGFKTLMRSAEAAGEEDEKVGKGGMAFAIILALLIFVGLFFVLPQYLASGMRKWFFISIGVICVVLGSIGIVTPVLPTTPFLLLAAYLFSRSSPKLHKFLLENRVFGKYLSNYFNNKPIPLKQKIISIFFIWLGLGLTIYFVDLQSWIIALLIFIGVAVSIHLSIAGKYRLRKKNSF